MEPDSLELPMDAFEDSVVEKKSGATTKSRPEEETDKKKITKGKKASLWALSGLRSLDIELTDTGNAVEFYNLGEQPVLMATIVHQSRMNWIAIALAFLLSLIHI